MSAKPLGGHELKYQIYATREENSEIQHPMMHLGCNEPASANNC